MKLPALLSRWSGRRRARAVEEATRAPAPRPPHASPTEQWGRGGGPIDPGFTA